ncbi:uncharacterized protein EI90DRAFT_3013863 [Cantharellus anzutake]|uniref:uncharacterized protein n=1 Tax=Cantharellus anzutake TaxID=1750568 RepID=UPI001906DA48|nr:uncharacterized protein EI90DRAFT_3013863 [Cantharellus anzutake]KAF8336864.1 hypothetical protein EI90DRAFT_3013863 [Cantharellus anzutake]
MADVGPYGNQRAARFNAWHEQGVCPLSPLAFFDSSLTTSGSAPKLSIKFREQLTVHDGPASCPCAFATFELDLRQVAQVVLAPGLGPEYHFRRTLPSPSIQKEFKHHIDLQAFDDQGADIPRGVVLWVTAVFRCLIARRGLLV